MLLKRRNALPDCRSESQRTTRIRSLTTATPVGCEARAPARNKTYRRRISRSPTPRCRLLERSRESFLAATAKAARKESGLPRFWRRRAQIETDGVMQLMRVFEIDRRDAPDSLGIDIRWDNFLAERERG